MGGQRGTPEERFWRKVIVTDGCWGWTGKPAANGYSMLSLTANRSIQGHRFSWALHNGAIPLGMQVGHRCHDEDESCVGLGNKCPHRLCTNPDHLYIQTPIENTRAGHGRDPALPDPRRLRTHCYRGHKYTEENTVWWKGKRSCRTCINLKQMERYYARKPKGDLNARSH